MLRWRALFHPLRFATLFWLNGSILNIPSDQLEVGGDNDLGHGHAASS